jgi:hypothetical protein
MIKVHLFYKGCARPERALVSEQGLLEHLTRWALRTNLEAITLSEDEVLIHLTLDHIQNLRNHGKTLLSSRGFVVPVLGSSTQKEVARA